MVDAPTPEQIRELARTSGKPLEVDCARAFLSYGHGWTASLGSYYEDGSGPPRELDVFAERVEKITHDVLPGLNTICRLRALVSCRGFPETSHPLTYSVAPRSRMVMPPNLRIVSRLQAGITGRGGAVRGLSHMVATRWTSLAGIAGSRPLVALDVLEPETNPERRKARSHKLKGDERLFGAIDSAVKAAMYWTRDDNEAVSSGFAILAVPICIFGKSFMDVGIEGDIAEPEERTCALQTNGYPMPQPEGYSTISTMIATRDRMPEIVEALENLFIEFREMVRIAIDGPPR